MARTDQAIIKRNAIFVREKKAGQNVYVRRPYDLVEYNWGDTTANRAYLQLIYGGRRSSAEKSEVYDDVRFFDVPPDWDTVRSSDL